MVRLSTTSPTGAPLKGLVFHDSFGDALRPFLSAQFSATEFAWGDDFKPALVDEVQPVVVIQVLAERRLFNRVRKNSRE